MEITLTVPDDLASRIRPLESHLPQILELGSRMDSPAGGEFRGPGRRPGNPGLAAGAGNRPRAAPLRRAAGTDRGTPGEEPQGNKRLLTRLPPPPPRLA